MKLVLSRKNEWTNRMRSFKILIDGQQIGTIGNGEVHELEVSSINHAVECKVDWCFSNKYVLNTKDGDVIYLQVRNGMSAFLLMYLVFIVFLISSFLMPNIWREFGETGLWIRRGIYTVPMVYIGYYLTIGRRQYLKIEKDTSNIFAS